MGKTSPPSREAAKKVQEARSSQFLARLFKRAGYKNSSRHPVSLLRFLYRVSVLFARYKLDITLVVLRGVQNTRVFWTPLEAKDADIMALMAPIKKRDSDESEPLQYQ